MRRQGVPVSARFGRFHSLIRTKRIEVRLSVRMENGMVLKLIMASLVKMGYSAGKFKYYSRLFPRFLFSFLLQVSKFSRPDTMAWPRPVGG